MKSSITFATLSIKHAYVIFDKNTHSQNEAHIENLKLTTLTSEYSSDKIKLLKKEELKEILIKENLVPIK